MASNRARLPHPSKGKTGGILGPNGRDCPKLTVAQSAYLAGLIDGEGSIPIYKSGKYYNSILLVANTCREVLVWAQRITGLGRVSTKKQHKGQRLCFVWNVTHKQAASILEKIQHLMIIKASRANLCIQLQTLKSLYRNGHGGRVRVGVEAQRSIYLKAKRMRNKEIAGRAK